MSDFGKFDVSLEANTDPVLSADDNYMLETLFKVCDIQSSGQVRVSKIITYLKQNALPDAAEVCLPNPINKLLGDSIHISQVALI